MLLSLNQHGPRVFSKGTLMPKDKKLICKHCKVEVCDYVDLRAVLGKEHKKGCPRRKRGL
jgi:hypothetical protein